jgi:hypothetical protein
MSIFLCESTNEAYLGSLTRRVIAAASRTENASRGLRQIAGEVLGDVLDYTFEEVLRRVRFATAFTDRVAVLRAAERDCRADGRFDSAVCFQQLADSVENPSSPGLSCESVLNGYDLEAGNR